MADEYTVINVTLASSPVQVQVLEEPPVPDFAAAGLEVVSLTEAEYFALTVEEQNDPTKWYVILQSI